MTTTNNNTDVERQPNAGYLKLLSGNPNFRNLWIGQLIAAGGNWFNNVACIGLTYELTGSGLAAGVVLIANSLPIFFLSPIAGPIVDRYDRRKIIIVAYLLGAVFALSLLLVRSAGMVWLVYLALALIVSTSSFSNPASQALVPNMVTKRELFSAMALAGSTWGIMVMVGSGVGGIISTLLGRDLVFILNSLCFLFAAFMVGRVKIPANLSRAAQTTRRASTWKDFGEGLVYLKDNLPAVSLVAVKCGWSLGAGVIALYSIFSKEYFKLGDDGIGYLFMGRGLGVLIGPLLIRTFVEDNPRRMRLVIIWSIILCGFGYIAYGFSAYLGIVVAVITLIIAHIGGGLMWALSSILLQEVVPDKLKGRVFSVDMGLATLSNSISTILFGFCLQLGASPILLALVGGSVFIFYGVLWGVISGRPPYSGDRENDEL
jgi:MFS family permease